MRNLECALHLFWECWFSRGVWTRLASWKGCDALNSASWGSAKTTTELTQRIIQGAEACNRKGIKFVIILAMWEIWQEHNNCIFRGKSPSQEDIMAAIRRVHYLSRSAGATCLSTRLGICCLRLAYKSLAFLCFPLSFTP